MTYNILSIFALEHFAKKNELKTALIKTKIKWNRFIIYGYFVACICNNIAGVIYFTSGYKETTTYQYATAILFFSYFTVILIRALVGSHFGEQIKISKASSFSKEELNRLKTRLEFLMNDQKPFLQFSLTLSELASRMEIKERQLSQFINSYYKMSFQDYINTYRIDEAKSLIEQYRHSGKTILEIVYESGFNSKSAFNFAFKKHTQTTPTNYKKTLQ
ncbi:helix-turn-helix domain-containing protein [Flavivirga eckloniae]|nr:AraC family transcriptional regulator [Flavivirga eckloniae]